MNEQVLSPVAPKTSDTSELRHIDQSVVKSTIKAKSIIKNNEASLLKNNVEASLVKTHTEKLKFRITPLMKVWLDKAIELHSISPQDISHESGIDRGTYYKWRKLTGFNDWYVEQWKAKRKQWIPALDVMGMNRASKNFDYWKAMNQKAGELLDNEDYQPQQRISILGGMTVQTVNNIKQETVDDK